MPPTLMAPAATASSQDLARSWSTHPIGGIVGSFRTVRCGGRRALDPPNRERTLFGGKNRGGFHNAGDHRMISVGPRMAHTVARRNLAAVLRAERGQRWSLRRALESNDEPGISLFHCGLHSGLSCAVCGVRCASRLGRVACRITFCTHGMVYCMWKTQPSTTCGTKQQAGCSTPPYAPSSSMRRRSERYFPIAMHDYLSDNRIHRPSWRIERNPTGVAISGAFPGTARHSGRARLTGTVDRRKFQSSKREQNRKKHPGPLVPRTSHRRVRSGTSASDAGRSGPLVHSPPDSARRSIPQYAPVRSLPSRKCHTAPTVRQRLDVHRSQASPSATATHGRLKC